MSYMEERIGDDLLINHNGRIAHCFGWFSDAQVFARKKAVENILNRCPELKSILSINKIPDGDG